MCSLSWREFDLLRVVHQHWKRVGAFALACTVSMAHSADMYYVADGSGARMVRGDTASVSVEEWSAYYFRRGAPTTQLSQAWGMNSNKDADALIRSVKNSQKFETRWERWCGCQWGQLTSFNVLMPVAKVKQERLSPATTKFLEKAHETWDRIQGLTQRFNAAADLAGEQRLPSMGLTGPLADFMRAMHSSVDRFLSLRQDMTRLSDADLANLEREMTVINASLSQASSYSAGAFEQIQGHPAQQSGNWMSNTYREQSIPGEVSTIRYDVQFTGKGELVVIKSYRTTLDDGYQIDAVVEDRVPLANVNQNSIKLEKWFGVWCAMFEVNDGLFDKERVLRRIKKKEPRGEFNDSSFVRGGSVCYPSSVLAEQAVAGLAGRVSASSGK